MKTLLEKVESGSLTQEEILDICLSLCSLIEEGSCGSVLNPGDILLDHDNKIQLREPIEKNYLFAAPEVILGGRESDKNAQWYSLGMLTDYMKNGQDYFTRTNTTVLSELKDHQGKRWMLEKSEDRSPLGAIAKKLTAVSAESRTEGVRELLLYLRSIKGNTDRADL